MLIVGYSMRLALARALFVKVSFISLLILVRSSNHFLACTAIAR